VARDVDDGVVLDVGVAAHLDAVHVTCARVGCGRGRLLGDARSERWPLLAKESVCCVLAHLPRGCCPLRLLAAAAPAPDHAA